jgi:hypothetical protein
MTRGSKPVNAHPAVRPLRDTADRPVRPVCDGFSSKKQEFRGETTVELTYSGQNRLNFLTILQISSQVFFLLLTSGDRIRGKIPWVPGPT